MNTKSFERLEFPKVLTLLAARTSFQPSRDLALALQPMTEITFVRQAQAETTQARTLLEKVGEVNTGGLRDIRSALNQLDLGRTLDYSDYLELRDCLQAMTRLGRFFRQLSSEEYSFFSKLGAEIGDFDNLVAAITKIFADSGEVKDSASSQLRTIRNQIKINQQRVRDKLATLISSAEYQKYLQESVVTIRGDRFVIPVKSENKGSIPGIVHDRSASGATLFIEPMVVVEINNTLRELQIAETQEIQRILRELTQVLTANLEEVHLALDRVAQADLFLAKGRLSQDLRGTEPLLNTEGKIFLTKARHPLLTGKVVPVDIQVGDSYRVLVITGPNTGGKTVTLKTAGLLTLMAQAGLHIPADAGGEVAVFTGVYCDIGDEQSIEQNLSTFSGHISNISEILQEMDNNALVLLDELGAGTDPQEGAALAVAILDYLVDKRCTAVVTTHYSELKTYAYIHPQIENASMEFDLVSLAPTYRIILGLPGKSNALEIATRLGLPEKVIKRAREARVGLRTELDEVLGEIGEELKLTRRARQEAEEESRAANQLKNKYYTLAEEIEEQRTELMAAARREAQAFVDQARSQLEAAIKQAREDATDQGAKEGRTMLEEVAQRLKQIGSEATPQEKQREELAVILEVGMVVYIHSLRAEGVILELNQTKKEALVQSGLLKVTVPFKDLSPSQSRAKKRNEPKVRRNFDNATQVIKTKRLTVPSEISVRGMTVEEAWDVLDKFLDDAVLAGYDSIRLIHGKGQGILRTVLRQRLAEHSAVKEYAEAALNQGGSGVTIVYLKQ